MSLGKKEKITGLVIVKKLHTGSKSEHEAIMIQTGAGPDLKIIMKGGNPFWDKALEPFIGMRVNLEGVLTSGRAAVFVDSISDITVLGPPGRPSRSPTPTGKPPSP